MLRWTGYWSSIVRSRPCGVTKGVWLSLWERARWLPYGWTARRILILHIGGWGMYLYLPLRKETGTGPSPNQSPAIGRKAAWLGLWRSRLPTRMQVRNSLARQTFVRSIAFSLRRWPSVNAIPAHVAERDPYRNSRNWRGRQTIIGHQIRQTSRWNLRWRVYLYSDDAGSHGWGVFATRSPCSPRYVQVALLVDWRRLLGLSLDGVSRISPSRRSSIVPLEVTGRNAVSCYGWWSRRTVDWYGVMGLSPQPWRCREVRRLSSRCVSVARSPFPHRQIDGPPYVRSRSCCLRFVADDSFLHKRKIAGIPLGTYCLYKAYSFGYKESLGYGSFRLKA